jgi:hypothetical protein
MSERRRVIGAASGALGLSGLAAAFGLCCSVPWAVALMGVTGAIAFARLAFLLPYTLIAAVVLLGIGFWWAYRSEPACAEGTCTPTDRRAPRWIVWSAALIVAALSVVALSGCVDAADPSPGYTALDDSAARLREDFNRAKGSVRLLFVVDPICPGCLRGLDDIDRALLRKTNDPRLQTFVVHVPYLGAKAKDVAPATKLLHNANVRHYWNESGAFGGLLSNAVDLRNGDKRVYAWDVWLIYGPEATWDGPAPPKPKLLMQQLWALQGSTRFPNFDSEVFAQEVQALLAASDP